MQVHHDEEVANRIDPESCAAACRESTLFPRADAVPVAEGNTGAISRAPRNGPARSKTRHVRTLLAREPVDHMGGGPILDRNVIIGNNFSR